MPVADNYFEGIITDTQELLAMKSYGLSNEEQQHTLAKPRLEGVLRRHDVSSSFPCPHLIWNPTSMTASATEMAQPANPPCAGSLINPLFYPVPDRRYLLWQSNAPVRGGAVQPRPYG